MARIRFVVASLVLGDVFALKEVHMDRHTKKKVCMRARSSELNMSFPRANCTTFWKHGQHLGKILRLQKTRMAIRRAMIRKTSRNKKTATIILELPRYLLVDDPSTSSSLTSIIGSTNVDWTFSAEIILKLTIWRNMS